MSKILAIVMAVLTVALVAAGSAGSERSSSASTPEAAVQAFYSHVKGRDWPGAYAFIAPASNIDQETLARDLGGKDGSLRTLSTLQEVNTRVLHENDNEALVRAATKWSTAVGAVSDARDLRVVKDNGEWKVVWPASKQQNLPPQVIPVNYLRWDIIHASGDSDWGSQDVAAPNTRIISMNAVEKQFDNGQTGVVVMGEIVNEDTVPGFVTV